MHEQIKYIELIYKLTEYKNIIKTIQFLEKCVTSSSQVQNNHDIFVAMI